MVVAAIQNTLEDTPDYIVINMTAANPINATQIAIQYRGKSKPSSVAYLLVYRYSLDNVTWYPMTVTEDSDVSGLNINSNWIEFNLTWEAMSDIHDKISNLIEDLYNRNIWVRFQASNGNLETYPIFYRLIFKNPIVKLGIDSSSNHIDINGNNLLEQAPGVF